MILILFGECLIMQQRGLGPDVALLSVYIHITQFPAVSGCRCYTQAVNFSLNICYLVSSHTLVDIGGSA